MRILRSALQPRHWLDWPKHRLTTSALERRKRPWTHGSADPAALRSIEYGRSIRSFRGYLVRVGGDVYRLLSDTLPAPVPHFSGDRRFVFSQSRLHGATTAAP
jgi:hypothetical protein